MIYCIENEIRSPVSNFCNFLSIFCNLDLQLFNLSCMSTLFRKVPYLSLIFKNTILNHLHLLLALLVKLLSVSSSPTCITICRSKITINYCWSPKTCRLLLHWFGLLVLDLFWFVEYIILSLV